MPVCLRLDVPGEACHWMFNNRSPTRQCTWDARFSWLTSLDVLLRWPLARWNPIALKRWWWTSWPSCCRSVVWGFSLLCRYCFSLLSWGRDDMEQRPWQRDDVHQDLRTACPGLFVDTSHLSQWWLMMCCADLKGTLVWGHCMTMIFRVMVWSAGCRASTVHRHGRFEGVTIVVVLLYTLSQKRIAETQEREQQRLKGKYGSTWKLRSHAGWIKTDLTWAKNHQNSKPCWNINVEPKIVADHIRPYSETHPHRSTSLVSDISRDDDSSPPACSVAPQEDMIQPTDIDRRMVFHWFGLFLHQYLSGSSLCRMSLVPRWLRSCRWQNTRFLHHKSESLTVELAAPTRPVTVAFGVLFVDFSLFSLLISISTPSSSKSSIAGSGLFLAVFYCWFLPCGVGDPVHILLLHRVHLPNLRHHRDW